MAKTVEPFDATDAAERNGEPVPRGTSAMGLASPAGRGAEARGWRETCGLG